jgi:ubiquinone/menaquinone biosynthesis C-methylase UbiE
MEQKQEGAMSGYLMEHPLEAERLELKTKRESILEEFVHIPLASGRDVLDMGCGTGAVTRIIAERVSPGQVVGLDASPERLAVAEELARDKGIGNVQYLLGDVRKPDLGERRFDLVYSRFLFQYLPGQAGMDTLMQMKGLARTDGTVCVAEIDGKTLYRYPMDKAWEETLEDFLREVEKLGFDPFVGRKLYSMFFRAGFRDIRVNILPYYLIAGKADPTTLRVWEMKIQILKGEIKRIFSSHEKADEVAERFLADLMSEEMLLYNLLFIVQGKV